MALGPIEKAPWPDSFLPPKGTCDWLAVPWLIYIILIPEFAARVQAAYGLPRVPDTNDRENRTESLFPSQSGIGRYAIEHRRLIKVAFPVAIANRRIPSREQAEPGVQRRWAAQPSRATSSRTPRTTESERLV